MANDLLPIAETFTSVHGEGFWAGTRMTFFRLAGCTVGKPSVGTANPDFPIINGRKADMCTAFDGRTFPCDTDFRKTASMHLEDLMALIPKDVSHVCVTGGEPLMHDHLTLSKLKDKLTKKKITMHIETSGTIDFPDVFIDNFSYIACSPKEGYLPFVVQNKVDEIRLMVDKHFDLPKALGVIRFVDKRTHLFLAPLSLPNNVNVIDPESMATCMHLLENPYFKRARISIQMHKILGVR